MGGAVPVTSRCVWSTFFVLGERAHGVNLNTDVKYVRGTDASYLFLQRLMFLVDTEMAVGGKLAVGSAAFWNRLRFQCF